VYYEAVAFNPDGENETPTIIADVQFDRPGDAAYWIKKYSDPELKWEVSRSVVADPISYCLQKIKLQMQAILALEDVVGYSLYLSPAGKVFRHDLYPEYKANRKDAHKPIYYSEMREYMQKQWKAEMTDGFEADDVIGIEQCTSSDETIICTIDKDLDMIPGWHYNYGKQTKYYVTPEEGLIKFYSQLLTGDRTDNIPGCKGIGPVKASRILAGAKDEAELYARCLHAHRSVNGGLDQDIVEEEMIRNGKLLWILRTYDGIWTPPGERP
jgi:DNA polymerase-1